MKLAYTEHVTATHVIEVLQGRIDDHSQSDRGDSSVTGDRYFTGTSSAKEYIDLYKWGWKEGRDSIKNSIETLLPKTRLILDQDIVGFAPSAPDYLSSNPEAMLKLDYAPARTVNIVVPIGWNAGIKSEQILKYGGAVATVLKSLIDARYLVNLMVAQYTKYGDKGVLTLIDIVKVGDVLDIDKIASCFHCSFFRRGIFALKEMSEDKDVRKATLGGYGRSYTLDKKTVEKELPHDESFLFFPPLDSNDANQAKVLDKAMKEVRDLLDG